MIGMNAFVSLSERTIFQRIILSVKAIGWEFRLSA